MSRTSVADRFSPVKPRLWPYCVKCDGPLDILTVGKFWWWCSECGGFWNEREAVWR